MKQAFNWLMTTHSVILLLKMTIPHGNGGNAMQLLTYWLLKDSLSLSLYLWPTTWHQQATWHREPPSLCGSLNLLSKDVSVWSFPGKGKAGRAQDAKKNDNNKKISQAFKIQAEEVEDKMVSKNLPKFLKVKLKGSKYEYIFQFFNVYFCITFKPTNTSSTHKMCRLAGFFVLLCWNELGRHITCLHHKWGEWAGRGRVVERLEKGLIYQVCAAQTRSFYDQINLVHCWK